MKYYGEIGFGITAETAPDVWEEQLVKKNYSGDVIQFSKRWSNGEGLNDDLLVTNKISIVADPFAFEHFQEIVYLTWMGTKWKVSDVSVEYPRLLLGLGGVYNE